MAMQRTAATSLRAIGLAPEFVFLAAPYRERWQLSPHELDIDGTPGVRVGYVPSLDFLNYVVPTVALRRVLSRYSTFVVVSGTSAAAVPLVLSGKRFISWIATTGRAEFSAAHRGSEVRRASLSVRLNRGLLPVNEAVERWVLRRTPKLFALSRRTAAEFEALGVTGSEVLYPPVDLERFRPKAAAGFPPPYVLGAGRVDDPRKDFPFLIRAVEAARRRVPNLSLVLAGAVAESSEVARLGRARLGDGFFAPGNMDESRLADAYAGASAFALTSLQEGLGIVVAEAMASGTPTVQRKCGGADELVQPDETGFLLETEDADGFAACLEKLASDAGVRSEMGTCARRRAELLFSADRFQRRFAQAHREIYPGL
jgi:glycosyltransferase involved in cell wall biosynthesis